MAGTKARTVVAVEVLVEQNVVAPVRVVLEFGRSSIDRPFSLLIAEEDAGQSVLDFLRHLEQVHQFAGTGWAFDLEAIAIVQVVLQQRPDDDGIHRHPHRATPIGVAAEHAAVRFGRQVIHTVFLPAGIENERVPGMELG